MRIQDGVQDILRQAEVKVEGEQMLLSGQLEWSLSLPTHDHQLPHRLEQQVETVGQALKRQLFGLLLECADADAVLEARAGKEGQGIQSRGTRPYPFKTRFGTVTIARRRVSQRRDQQMTVPSAQAWQTPPRLCITQGLRDEVCDGMRDLSVRHTHERLDAQAAEEDVLGDATIVALVHEEGKQLLAAGRQRAQDVLGRYPEAAVHLLAGADPASAVAKEDADPAAVAEEISRAEVLQTAVGFVGAAAVAAAVTEEQPRQVDEGSVLLQVDEVKTKAQAHCAVSAQWVYTGVLLVGNLRYYLAEATPAHLWRQVAALLCVLGVGTGQRRLVLLADGAAWIRRWFEHLDVAGKCMILCWFHLAEKCYQRLSAAGCSKERRQALEKEILGHLWEGRLDEALQALNRCRAEMRQPKFIDDLLQYLEKRRVYLPNYKERHAAGLWIASNRVEKWNDWAVSQRCKHQGMSWTEAGVLALASLQAARYNQELEHWRSQRSLPPWPLPETLPQAA